MLIFIYSSLWAAISNSIYLPEELMCSFRNIWRSLSKYAPSCSIMEVQGGSCDNRTSFSFHEVQCYPLIVATLSSSFITRCKVLLKLRIWSWEGGEPCSLQAGRLYKPSTPYVTAVKGCFPTPPRMMSTHTHTNSRKVRHFIEFDKLRKTMYWTYITGICKQRHWVLSKEILITFSQKSFPPALFTGCIVTEGREKFFIADVHMWSYRTGKTELGKKN